MKKKTLVSILAMTSVSMGAYADANVDLIKEAVADWDGATDLGYDFTNKVIVSPKGTSITQTIGKLVPGTYSLIVENSTNAKLLVNGQPLTNNQFKLTAETEVTITVAAVASGQAFSVGGFDLNLVYDKFASDRQTLELTLARFMSQITGNDEIAEKLRLEGSEYSARIAKLKDDEGTATGAYQVYKDEEIYKGVENSKLMADIKEFGTGITNNAVPYFTAKQAYDEMKSNYATALSAINDINNANGAKDYTSKIVAAKSGKVANDYIEKFLTDAKDAYEKGTAAEFVKGVADFKTEATKKIKAVSTEITTAPQDHTAYLDVKGLIEDLKTKYNKAVQDVVGAFKTENDVYAAKRQDATDELLMQVLNVILDVEANNGSEADHSGVAAYHAEEGSVAKLNALDGATGTLETLKNKHVAVATNLKQKYSYAIGLYEGLKTDIEEKEKMDVIKEQTVLIANIKQQIEDFKAEIEKDNSAAGKFAIATKNYEAEGATVDKIEKAIENLIVTAVGSQDQYDAYERVLGVIGGLEKLYTTNKTAVEKLNSGEVKLDGQAYSAKELYNTLEQGFFTTISGYRAAIGVALSKQDATGWETENSAALSQTKTDLNSYLNNATTAKGQFVTLAKQLNAYKAAIDALIKKVGSDRDVWLYGAAEYGTYGSKIDEFQGIYDKIYAATKLALTKTDADHLKFMNEAADALTANTVNIVADATALIGKFDADKAGYEAAVVDQVIASLTKQAQAKLEEINGKLTTLNQDLTEPKVGRQLGELQDQWKNVKSTYGTLNGKLTNLTGTDAEKMALLSEINAEVTALQTGKLRELETGITTAKSHVAANNEQYKKADTYLKDIDAYLNGGTASDNKTYTAVKDLYKDAERQPEFEKSINTNNTTLRAYRTQIETSYDAEKLVAEWTARTDAQGKPAPGFKELLDLLKADVNKLIADANNSAKNRKNYDELVTYYTVTKNIQQAINNAKADVQTVTQGDASEDYYLNTVISGYETEYDEGIVDAIRTAYEKRQFNDGKGNWENQINTLWSNIERVDDDAKANKKAYEDLLGTYDDKYLGYNGLTYKWDKVYLHISTTDQTSAAEGYLNHLKTIQDDYEELKGNIDVDYEKGQSLTNFASKSKQIADYLQKVIDIENEQAGKYDGMVENDNNARFDRFSGQVTNLRKEYSKAIATINQYSTLQNAGFVENPVIIKDAVEKANKDINEVLTWLSNEQAIVNKELEEANSAKTLFDEFETHTAAVIAKIAEVQGILSTMDATVSGEAKQFLVDQINAAQNKLDAAQSEIDHYTTKDKAFSDVKGYIMAAQEDLKEEHILTLIQPHVDNFAQIDTKLAEGKEAAAKYEGSEQTKRVRNKVGEQWKDLTNKFTYTNAADKDYYINSYKPYKEAVVNAIDAYEKAVIIEGKVAFGEVIDALLTAVNIFNTAVGEVKVVNNGYQIVADGIYAQAYVSADNQVKNKDAYDRLLGATGIEKLEKELIAVEDYASEFIALSYELINERESAIETLKQDFEKWYRGGYCAVYENAGKSDIATELAAITRLYAQVNSLEEAQLRVEILNLRVAQDEAIQAVAGTEFEEEVKAYEAKIATLNDDYEAELLSDEFLAIENEQDKKPVYLRYEKEIAKMRAELAVYVNTAADQVYTDLLAKISDVRTEQLKAVDDKLSASHDNVKAQFQTERDAISESIDALVKELDGYNDDGQVIFAETKITKQVGYLIAELENLLKNVQTAQKPYTVSAQEYIRLTTELGQVGEALRVLETKVAAFQFDLWANYASDVASINGMIEKTSESLKEQEGSGHLFTPNDQLEFVDENGVTITKSDVEALISICDKEVTYNELNLRISSDAKGKGLYNLYDEVADMISELNNPTNSDWVCAGSVLEELKAERDEIQKLSIGHMPFHNMTDVSLYAYNYFAANLGKIYYDINGNQLVDENGDPVESKNVKYLDVAPAIEVRINELKAQVAALKQKTEENRFKLGDMDRDGSVVVDDYMAVLDIVLNYTEEEKEALSELKFMTADANQDGSINIGDLTAITNTILGVENSRMQYIKARTAETVDGAITLGLENQEGVQRIAVRLSNAAAYTSYQMDVKLPAGVSVMSASLGMGAADHEIYTNTLADGTYRVVVTSMQNNNFANGDDALIYLEVSGKAAAQVNVTEAMAADATGKVYNVRGIGGGETTGIDGVTADQSMKAKIYSVGGQLMDKVTRGINIIRNADGTTKKVLKK